MTVSSAVCNLLHDRSTRMQIALYEMANLRSTAQNFVQPRVPKRKCRSSIYAQPSSAPELSIKHRQHNWRYQDSRPSAHHLATKSPDEASGHERTHPSVQAPQSALSLRSYCVGTHEAPTSRALRTSAGSLPPHRPQLLPRQPIHFRRDMLRLEQLSQRHPCLVWGPW